MDGSQRHPIKVGAGLLPFLRVGTLWKNGQALPRPVGVAATLRDLVISSETVTPITMGMVEPNADKRNFIVPPFAYRVGKLGLSSNVVAIRQGDDPYSVLLPTTELLRFYYAGSTNLTSLAIFGAYSHSLDQIINPQKSGYIPKLDRCALRLRRWIHDDDGWLIGRVLNSAIAKQGIRRVYDSIVYRMNRGENAHLDCGFPFAGKTRWHARGMHFKSPRGEDRFLIFELTRCSAPFPFTELLITRDNSGEQTNAETNIPEEERKPCWAIQMPSVNKGAKPGQSLQSRKDPSSQIAPVSIIQIEARFDAIDREIIKPEKAETPYKSAQVIKFHNEQIAEYSTGDAHGDSFQVGQLEARIHTRRKGSEPSFEYMIQAAEKLNSDPDICASLRSASYEHYSIPLTKPPTKNQWAYLNSKAKTYRHAWAIDILYQDISSCFVDYELRTKGEKRAALVQRNDGSRLSENDFYSLLVGIAKNEGRWKLPYYARQGLVVLPRKHTWSSGEELAEAIRGMVVD